jgi:TonB-dependent SusC/RagA subfamily outer membrane receptor
MKTFFIILFFTAGATAGQAQDSFQKELFSADLALKYRAEIGLTTQQVGDIKKIHSDHMGAFTSKKWDLDAQVAILNKFVAQPAVDEKASLAQMDKVMKLEGELKHMKLAVLIKIKNELKESQQEQLKKLRTENDLTSEGTPEQGTPSISSLTRQLTINDNPRIQFRATGNQDGEKPLLIVNGQPMPDMWSFDPDAIESMTVLKSATAMALYGSGAKNGAIIITLKPPVSK